MQPEQILSISNELKLFINNQTSQSLKGEVSQQNLSDKLTFLESVAEFVKDNPLALSQAHLKALQEDIINSAETYIQLNETPLHQDKNWEKFETVLFNLGYGISMAQAEAHQQLSRMQNPMQPGQTGWQSDRTITDIALNNAWDAGEFVAGKSAKVAVATFAGIAEGCRLAKEAYLNQKGQTVNQAGVEAPVDNTWMNTEANQSVSASPSSEVRTEPEQGLLAQPKNSLNDYFESQNEENYIQSVRNVNETLSGIVDSHGSIEQDGSVTLNRNLNDESLLSEFANDINDMHASSEKLSNDSIDKFAPINDFISDAMKDIKFNNGENDESKGFADQLRGLFERIREIFQKLFNKDNSAEQSNEHGQLPGSMPMLN